MSTLPSEPGLSTRETVVKLIEALVDELRGPEAAEWQNVTAHDYLDALGGWLSGCAGYYRHNFDQDVPDNACQILADALIAAKTYE